MPAFTRVVRSGIAHVIRCGAPPRDTATARLPTFSAADVATAWIAEYRALLAREVRP